MNAANSRVSGQGYALQYANGAPLQSGAPAFGLQDRGYADVARYQGQVLEHQKNIIDRLSRQLQVAQSASDISAQTFAQEQLCYDEEAKRLREERDDALDALDALQKKHERALGHAQSDYNRAARIVKDSKREVDRMGADLKSMKRKLEKANTDNSVLKKRIRLYDTGALEPGQVDADFV